MLAAAAVTALGGCEPRPQARAFDTRAREAGDGPVALMGGPEAAGDRGRAATATVNGFELVDAAPSATEDGDGLAPAGAGGPGGFEMLAAAPEAETAAPAVAEAAPVALAGGPAQAPAAVPTAAARPRPPARPAAQAAARAAAPEPIPLAQVALIQAPGFSAPAPARTAPRAQAPAPPPRPGGGAEMFAACLLAAGALWRWHKACLRAVERRPAPEPLLLPAPEKA
jgi:hypothetical protein